MSLPAELQEASQQVCNWGRWGADDQLGTLNFLTPERVTRALAIPRKGQCLSLSIPIDAYGPQGAHGFRRNPIHLMIVDGGDHAMNERLSGWGGPTEAYVREMWEGPARFNDDYIMMPLQAATQWDALAHVYYNERLYNGYPSDVVTSFGATRNSIDQVAAAGHLVARGVLLDVARHRGVPRLPEGASITPEELTMTAQAQGVEIKAGDVVLVRTGWWPRFLERRDGETWLRTAPGLAWQCALWLHEHEIAAVAADNMAVETSTRAFPGVRLPLHMLTLRDMGMMLGEIWDLEALGGACAQDGSYEFLLVAQPLPFTGAVGSPVNPIAIR